MERLTSKQLDGKYHLYEISKITKTTCCDESGKNAFDLYEGTAIDKLGAYEDAEEQGLLLRLPIGQDRSDLIYILARLLMHTEFGNCYLCTNPMKNITLDEKNNGCDGNCRVDEKFDEDDLITKIIKELQTKEEAPTVYAVPLKDVYRIIAGHSDYHGDSILSALQCIAEGKEVKPIKPIEV